MMSMNEPSDSSDSDTEPLSYGSTSSVCTSARSSLLEDDDLDTTDLGPYDVVCGRHKTAFNNIGNRRFRYTVALALERYLRAPTRKARSMIIARLAELVQENGGRFLEQQETKQGHSGSATKDARERHNSKQWVELSCKKSHQKVGHALRDMALVGTTRHKEATAQRRKQRRKRNTAATTTTPIPTPVGSSSPSVPSKDFVTIPPLTSSIDDNSSRTYTSSTLESCTSCHSENVNDCGTENLANNAEMDLHTLMTLFSSSLTSLDVPLQEPIQPSSFTEKDFLLEEFQLAWNSSS